MKRYFTGNLISLHLLTSNEVNYKSILDFCIGYKSYCFGFEYGNCNFPQYVEHNIRIMLIFIHICIYINKIK
jgi:hypothetical protein